MIPVLAAVGAGIALAVGITWYVLSVEIANGSIPGEDDL